MKTFWEVASNFPRQDSKGRLVGSTQPTAKYLQISGEQLKPVLKLQIIFYVFMCKHQEVIISTYPTEIFTFFQLRKCEKAVSNQIVSLKELLHLHALKISNHITHKLNLITISGP